MLIYFEIHIKKDSSNGYIIENLNISDQKEIKSNIGFDVVNIDSDNEIYSILADFNQELDVVGEIQEIFDRVRISFFRKMKLDKLKNNLYNTK